jgi:hypothetical protein
VRPIYEDAKPKALFKACSDSEEVRFKFYLMSGFRDAEGAGIMIADIPISAVAFALG